MTKRRRDSMIATASVLAWRLPMLSAMMWDPTPARRAEALLMITEKQAAFTKGLVDANAAAAKASLSLWSKSMARKLKAGDLQKASDRITAAAHKPSEIAVRANARRLKGRKI